MNTTEVAHHELNELHIADDQNVIFDQNQNLDTHIDVFNHDMKINIDKTDVTTRSITQSAVSIQINHQTRKQVHELKYLGSMFTLNRRFDRAIETPVNQANWPI